MMLQRCTWKIALPIDGEPIKPATNALAGAVIEFKGRAHQLDNAIAHD